MDDSVWIRLPDEGERCPVSGLSRTSLAELLEETDPVTGEKLIVSMVKRKEGAKRGIRMIKKQSLLDYLERQAAFQCGLRVADHIPNPERLTIDEIVSDMEIFKFFVGVDNELRDERLLEGDLSTRRARISCLLRNGIIIRDSVSLPPEGKS